MRWLQTCECFRHALNTFTFTLTKTHFNGRDFFRILFTRPTVALNSSGATRDCKPAGKFVLKLLLNPKLQLKMNKNRKFFHKSNGKHVLPIIVKRKLRWENFPFEHSFGWFKKWTLNSNSCSKEKIAFLKITYTVIFPVPRIMIGSSFGIFGGGIGSSSCTSS